MYSAYILFYLMNFSHNALCSHYSTAKICKYIITRDIYLAKTKRTGVLIISFKFTLKALH